MYNNLLKVLGQVNVDPKDIDLPRASVDDVTIGNILQVVFAAAGAIAALIITIAALQYVISRGEPQSVNKAKETILYAAIGLVLCVSAFAIVSFVVGRV